MADNHELIELTAVIVAAYVANNPVPASNLPELIREVHSKISSLASSAETKEPEPGKPQTPAVNPKKSVHADHIVCLEEGLKFTSLKRHLMTSHGLTPEGYRKKWAWRLIIRWSRPNTRPDAPNWPRILDWATLPSRQCLQRRSGSDSSRLCNYLSKSRLHPKGTR